MLYLQQSHNFYESPGTPSYRKHTRKDTFKTTIIMNGWMPEINLQQLCGKRQIMCNCLAKDQYHPQQRCVAGQLKRKTVYFIIGNPTWAASLVILARGCPAATHMVVAGHERWQYRSLKCGQDHWLLGGYSAARGWVESSVRIRSLALTAIFIGVIKLKFLPKLFLLLFIVFKLMLMHWRNSSRHGVWKKN